VRVGVERELGGEVISLGADMVDDAVDGERALEDGWAAGHWVSTVVDGDAGPASLAGGAHTIRPPDASGIILEEGGLGEVVMNDLSAKDVDTLPVYRFYPIQDRAAAIGSRLEVLNVGSGVEEVVVGREMEVEYV